MDANNSYHKDESNDTSDSCYTKNSLTYHDMVSDVDKIQRNWNVKDAMHSYFVEGDRVNDCNRSKSTQCGHHEEDSNATLVPCYKKQRAPNTRSFNEDYAAYADATLDSCYKKQRPPNYCIYDAKDTTYFDRIHKNWGVYDAMHSYFGEGNNVDDCSESECSSIPVADTVTKGIARDSQRNFAQLQSSWNVLGVKPTMS